MDVLPHKKEERFAYKKEMPPMQRKSGAAVSE